MRHADPSTSTSVCSCCASGMLMTLHGWGKVMNVAGGGRYSFDGWWAGRRHR